MLEMMCSWSSSPSLLTYLVRVVQPGKRDRSRACACASLLLHGCMPLEQGSTFCLPTLCMLQCSEGNRVSMGAVIKHQHGCTS
jgi:hypothetical protein